MKRGAFHYWETIVHGCKRHEYCWTQRAGATAWVKRFTNRRERREGKREQQEQHDAK